MKVKEICLGLLFIILLFGCTSEIEQAPNLDISNASDQLEIFGESLISTPLYERDMAISPDGNELIFTRGDYKQTRRCLVKMQKVGDQWRDQKVLELSGEYSDIEPFYSPDGNQLFFASNRPMDSNSDRKDYNIWVAEKVDGNWTNPQPLSDSINTEKDEFYPSVGRSGNLYFTATYDFGVGREDIFVSQYKDGVYSKPMPLDTNVNTTLFEFNAYVSPDENVIVFSSFGRKDGLGGGDLYLSQKGNDGNWQPAIHLDESINSPQLDFSPFIDFERSVFYFTSERPQVTTNKIQTIEQLKTEANKVLNGFGNIYKLDLEQLNL